MSAVDRLLGRLTMYRLVIVSLGVLAVWSVVAAMFGWLDRTVFSVDAMLLTLIVLVLVSVLTNAVVGRLVGATPHRDSAIITALLLWFLFWPTTDPVTLGWLAAATALANLSKYAIAVRRRHLVNPAAAGVVLLLLLRWATGIESIPFTTWWAASSVLFPVVLVGALLVLRRTQRLRLGLAFVLVALPVTVWGLLSFGADLPGAVRQALGGYPIVFCAGFMLSEPLTLPPRRWQQLLVAVLGAAVFTWPLWSFAAFGSYRPLGPFESTYELALVVTGVVGFLLGQRGQIALTLRERRPLGDDVYEYWFRPLRPVRFQPGQYVELQVPHTAADARGVRRMLSIASAPGDDLAVAVRMPERSSSFKRALLAAEPGSRWAATAVHGDFVLPRDPSAKVLMVAGGIGITPFMSHLRAGVGRRDVVLVYGVRDDREVPYREELATLGVDVRLLVGGVLDGERIAAVVPDLGERIAYVSGPPAMVDAVRRSLRSRVRRVRLDVFLGY